MKEAMEQHMSIDNPSYNSLTGVSCVRYALRRTIKVEYSAWLPWVPDVTH
jgi:hypothetical protein